MIATALRFNEAKIPIPRQEEDNEMENAFAGVIHSKFRFSCKWGYCGVGYFDRGHDPLQRIIKNN